MTFKEQIISRLALADQHEMNAYRCETMARNLLDGLVNSLDTLAEFPTRYHIPIGKALEVRSAYRAWIIVGGILLNRELAEADNAIFSD